MSFQYFLSVLFCSVAVTHGLWDSWEQEETLDARNKFRIFWNITDQNATIKLMVQTSGWVGLGISDSGSMAGADIIVGWVKNGKAFISDRHGGSGNGFPPKDDHQDVKLLKGIECDGWTTLAFTRKLRTCDDPQDRPITENTMKLLFAYSAHDPIASELSALDYHSFRSSKSFMFLQRPKHEDDEEYESFALLNDGSPMSRASTYYHCRIVEIPENIRGKIHIVKIDPVIEGRNDAHVHHMQLQLCPSVLQDSSVVGQGGDCYSGTLQDSRRCIHLVTGWGKGGRSFVFPKDVGYPLGLPGQTRYFKLEIHYDNPDNADIRDHSGFRMSYTRQYRHHEAGVLMVGHYLAGYNLLIPKHTEEFDVYGTCGKKCLEGAFEKANINSINVFGGFLHTHLAGKKVALRHIRNNTELPPLISDQNYDFDFQDQRSIFPEKTVRKGDYLQSVCTYSTKKKAVMTEGGLSTAEEMCASFIYYYPSFSLSICNSAPVRGLDIVKNMIGVSGLRPSNRNPNYLLNRFRNWVVTSPSGKANQSLDVAIDRFPWTKALRKSLSNQFRESPLLQMCVGPQPEVSFQEILPPLEPYQEYEYTSTTCVRSNIYNVTSLASAQCPAGTNLLI